jgi:biotin-[acetyl-CoA-carboxylase] ligase BirA-like protein
MAVYTDSPALASTLLQSPAEAFVPGSAGSVHEQRLLSRIFEGSADLLRSSHDIPGCSDLLIRSVAPRSQYDELIALLREGTLLPDRLACLAAAGDGFHGFRGRSWSAIPGNLHLTFHFAPRLAIERFDTVFTALAAVSLAESIDSIPALAGRVRVKWVNDVLVDGAKVGGVLAYTQSQGAVVESVVLGLGLNVESTPRVERSPFVPAAGSIRDALGGGERVRLADVLRNVLERLAANYATLLETGYHPIMERYRSCSAVLGEHVTVCTEDGTTPARVLASGRVDRLGDGMELHISGSSRPIRSGRLLLGAVAPEAINE